MSSNPFSLIPSFRVIDCETYEVVRGSDIEVADRSFVALSYLWGRTVEEPRFYKTLPESIPPTIKDAIKVTKWLGYRYIWIDRFCINQTDEADVIAQVSKMDAIYSGAQLTLVAAAGDGPEHGLPGVSPRLLCQPSAKVGKHVLVSTLNDPVASIRQSRWSTRGWTYQEGLLSRRRLIFTDEQVYFECQSMYCCEVLNTPLADLHTSDHQRFKSRFCNNSNVGLFPKSFGSNDWEIVERIEEHTQRTISNQSDTLKALLGILRALGERSKNPVRHCFGVPILPSPPRVRKRTSNGRTISPDPEDAYDPFEWTSVAGFCTGLCWNVNKPRRRKHGFPTWSWTGWQGKITWGFRKDDWRHVQGDPDVVLRLQRKDGSICTWSEFEADYERVPASLTNVIHISAWVTPLHNLFVRPYLSQIGPKITAEVESEAGKWLIWSFKPTTKTRRVLAADSLGVHIAHNRIVSAPEIYIMVVSRRDSGPYQRVGSFSFNEFRDRESDTGSPQPIFTYWQPCPAVKKFFQEISLS
ncbi:HET-domain-containing protein [Paramyrothecium foliicola]|nr:HET-domain-containing protein [Paramyrothecium foliicola]